MIAQGLSVNDRYVFHDMYCEYAKRLLGYLVSRGFRPAEAEDISQEIWLKIWKKRSLFDGSDFVAWMFRIAKNCIVDLIRQSKTRQHHMQSLQQLFDIRLDRRGSPLDSMIDDEILLAAKACLAESECVFLNVLRAQLDGEPVERTAARLGISENTVYSRRNRGKHVLRELLANWATE